MVKGKIEEISNGLIPVKYDDCEVMYDTKTNEFFAVIRISAKKMSFQQIKE